MGVQSDYEPVGRLTEAVSRRSSHGGCITEAVSRRVYVPLSLPKMKLKHTLAVADEPVFRFYLKQKAPQCLYASAFCCLYQCRHYSG